MAEEINDLYHESSLEDQLWDALKERQIRPERQDRGYVHLFDNTPSGGKFAELDTYAIDEAHDESYASGFGDLSVHEVATDKRDALHAYLSYYSGGLRSLEIQCSNPSDTSSCELVEVGGYLDPEGNDFWGVETFVRDGCTYIAGSDRDSGLWLFMRSGSCPP